jgi:alpha-beta hydrolase superfamily lysophospholipase
MRHRRIGFGLAVDMIEVGEELFSAADRWEKPLRLWHSNSDEITSFEASRYFATHAKRCQFTALDGVRHEAHQDRSREEVYALMVEFIRGKS